MRPTVALISLLLCLAAILPAYAETARELLQFADDSAFEQLAAGLQALPVDQLNTPISLYCRALLEQDGEQALLLYHKALAADEDEIIADRALWRIAQYYYANGYYVRTRAYLQHLVDDYPSGVELIRARRLLETLSRAGIKDQPVTPVAGLPPVLQNQAANREDNPVAAPIPESQTQREQQSTVAATPPPAVSLPPVGSQFQRLPAAETTSRNTYAVQVDAFSSEGNAQKRVDQLHALNFRDARVVPRMLLGKRLYPVWVGKFSNEIEARRLGEAMRIRGYIKNFVVKEQP